MNENENENNPFSWLLQDTNVLEHGNESDDIVVQGKTLNEWLKQADENVRLEKRGEKHVHPELPVGRKPTTPEVYALINSLTPLETLEMAMKHLGLDGFSEVLNGVLNNLF